jgi:hypothetical protein
MGVTKLTNDTIKLNNDIMACLEQVEGSYKIKDVDGLVKLSEEIDDLAKEASENEETYTEVKNRFEQWGYENTKKIESNSAEMDRIKNQIQDLNTQIQGYNAQQQDIKTQIDDDNATIDDLQKKIISSANMNGDTGWNWFKHWQNYIPGYSIAYDIKEMKKYKSDLEDYTSKVSACILESNQLTIQKGEINNKIVKMQAQISDLSAINSSLKNECGAVKSQITLFSQSTTVFRNMETGLANMKDMLGFMKDVDIPSELVDVIVKGTNDILNTSKNAQEDTQKQAKMMYDDMLINNERAVEIFSLLAEG